VANVGGFVVCSFGSTDEIKGLQGKRKLYGAAAERVYAALKATVLKAGRFSVFEATSSMRAAHMFTRLCEDPELEVVVEAFPWTGIKLKEKQPCSE
jgi:hypothetical protein